ncbi:MAG: cysteine hydrolase [Selenomonadaceae bacterium]|nr:cysteine hydrolase [Selenomonadaceae bacterium]
MDKAIIVIDMQNDFVYGVLGTDQAREMLPRLIDKLEKVVKEKSADLIFTQDTHKEDYLTTQEGKNLPVVHCIKNSEGWELISDMKRFTPFAKAVIEKKTFGSTRLPSLIKPYKEVEFVGVCTDICIISNALLVKAFYPELVVSVDAECCAGTTPENHAIALTAMKNCQCVIYNA